MKPEMRPNKLISHEALVLILATGLLVATRIQANALKKSPAKSGRGSLYDNSDDLSLPQLDDGSANPLKVKQDTGQQLQLAQLRSVVPSQRVEANQEPKFSKNDQSPAHWWALEDYYSRMRQAARQQPQYVDLSKIQQQQQQQVHLYDSPHGLTQQIQQELGDSLSGIRAADAAQEQLRWRLLANAASPKIQYPSIVEQKPDVKIQQQQQLGDFDSQRTVPLQLPVTPIGGLGAGSVMLTIGQQPNGSVLLSQQQLMQLQRMIAGQLLAAPSQGQPTLVPANELSQMMGQLNMMQLQRHPLFGQVSLGAEPKALDWLSRPEVNYAQLQYERLRHQYKVFGNNYNLANSLHELQWEAYCGPRNWIDRTGERRRQLAAKLEQLAGWDQLQQQQQLRLSSQLLPAELGDLLKASEFPSHVGLYNNTIEPDNYLCAGTWIHESFALTYASCLRHLEPRQIRFRLGEWRLDTTSSQEEPQAELVEGRVRRVHVSPWFKESSLEHNLALVEFERPVDFLRTPYASPACQLASRSSLRASSCWAPTRNVTLEEYFDASGEGETRERKLVRMGSSPVKLVVRDEDECHKLTKLQYFILKNPNYFCAGEASKQNDWRLKLNKPESLGAGIYCNEGGNVLTLVSMVHPINQSGPSNFGYLDLAYYKPWITDVVFGLHY